MRRSGRQDCPHAGKCLNNIVPPWDSTAESLESVHFCAHAKTMVRSIHIVAKAAFGFTVLSAASAAHAAGATVIPEPTDLMLFSMGVLGLIVGRQIARKKPPRD